ncbi:MAG: NAD(P)-binding domain-containing protein [Bacteroidales bacterium]|nr:NAD(P)-binding domain-containing protein [Bacteroidales bacterium]
MIGILGSGSWATAVAKILLEQPGTQLCWYVREPEIRQSLADHGRNYRYLGEVPFDPSRLIICEEAQEVVEQCDTIYLLVPTAYLHNVMQSVNASMLRERTIVSGVKGFIPETNEIVTDYLQHLYQVPAQQLAVISGPTHAEEVARERLTFITCASDNPDLAERVRQQIRCRYINANTSSDVRGIQFATALKNVYAVAAGLVVGLGYGDNLLAVMVCHAIVEIHHFLATIQPSNQLTIYTPQQLIPYGGDLLVTCYSQFSRNRRLGTMIGRGYSVKSAQLEMDMVAEGYYASYSLEKIRKILNIEMPIAQSVYSVLYQNARPDLLLRAWQIYKN